MPLLQLVELAPDPLDVAGVLGEAHPRQHVGQDEGTDVARRMGAALIIIVFSIICGKITLAIIRTN
jgi:hypothetical protein